ncbi:MAG TPA: hypothetical protein VFU23_01580 [Gemmatimonadales bacterium]|nr:hypothetical protein [Gemmatimonadales bacterium]
MRRTLVLLAAAGALAGAALAAGSQPAKADAFEPVARVLLSPRCRNCHPAGDAPLQTDASRPHIMNVRRDLEGLGTPCGGCHRNSNSPAPHQPPGAPNWRMPSAATPMIFEGKTPAQLCRDLKDPTQNGKKSLAELVNHVSSDALVLWAWSPGPGRTPPPLSHEEFTAAFKRWADLRGPCP